MSEKERQQVPPRIFISYSHDSPEHADRILNLAQQLLRDGVEVSLDRFVADSSQGPPQGWPRWCAEQILTVDFTLLVCTAAYRQRFLGLDAFGRDRGVKWEATVIQDVLYYTEVNTGFMPLILRPEDADQIPETVRDASYYLVTEATPTDTGYLALRERLCQGQTWPSLPVPASHQHQAPMDISIPTEEVWEASERIAAELTRIRHAQESHERGSRHLSLILAIFILILIVLGGLSWVG